MNLSALQTHYLQLSTNALSVAAFEEWLYSATELEAQIGEALYEELITLNYQEANIKSDLRKLLAGHIDVNITRTTTFLRKLDHIINRSEEMAEVLQDLYDDYQRGYRFLEDLGMGIGLLIRFPPAHFAADGYADLSSEQQDELLNRLHPAAKTLAQELKQWIVNQEIILSQEEELIQDELQYIDHRSESEKNSRIWQAEHDPISGEIAHKQHRLLDAEGRIMNYNSDNFGNTSSLADN